jgi:hypothetical protein
VLSQVRRDLTAEQRGEIALDGWEELPDGLRGLHDALGE